MVQRKTDYVLIPEALAPQLQGSEALDLILSSFQFPAPPGLDSTTSGGWMSAHPPQASFQGQTSPRRVGPHGPSRGGGAGGWVGGWAHPPAAQNVVR